jgi:hypothetical protein
MAVGGGLGALAGAAAARLAAAAALLVAAAAVVVIAGGGGLLGPLGALVGADAERRTSSSSPSSDRSRPARADAIVAVASTRAPSSLSTAGPGAPSRRSDPRGPEGSPPSPRPPGAAPDPGAPGTAPAGGAPPSAPPPPGEEPRMVDRVDQAIDDAAAQAPEPARPVIEPVQALVDRVVEECKRVPTCP